MSHSRSPGFSYYKRVDLKLKRTLTTEEKEDVKEKSLPLKILKIGYGYGSGNIKPSLIERRIQNV